MENTPFKPMLKGVIAGSREEFELYCNSVQHARHPSGTMRYIYDPRQLVGWTKDTGEILLIGSFEKNPAFPAAHMLGLLEYLDLATFPVPAMKSGPDPIEDNRVLPPLDDEE